MYRTREIQDALLHLVGWPQAYDPAKAIDPALTESESGLTFAQHPLVTLDNIAAIVPDGFIMQYPEWQLAKIYPAGAKVQQAGKVWYSLMDMNTEHSPAVSPTWWKEYNLLSDYLEQATRTGISTVLQKFTNDKLNRGETKNLLERRPFFDGAGNLRATVKNTGSIVGYEITPIRAAGVTMRVQRIGLQVTGASGAITLYVFHSSSPTPHWTKTVQISGDKGAYQWFDISDLILPYNDKGGVGQHTNDGGSWYLCYVQDGLPVGAEAINITRDWSKGPCSSCNQGEVQVWRETTKYMEIHPFKVPTPNGFVDAPELWDIERMVYTYDNNYGINVEVSVDCDITDFIIRQRQAFASVLAKQVAATMLRTIALNPDVKVNRNQLNVTRIDVLYELDGSEQSAAKTGLGIELTEAYSALYIDTAGMDRVCLPCNNHGVKYTVA